MESKNVICENAEGCEFTKCIHARPHVHYPNVSMKDGYCDEGPSECPGVTGQCRQVTVEEV